MTIKGILNVLKNLITPIISPPADSTTAVIITKADGSTPVVTIDTTNGHATITGTLTASNISGTTTNTGDETQTSIKSKLGAASAGVDGYLTGTDWSTFNGKQDNLGFTPEDVANKSISVVTDGTSDTKYPSVKAVKSYADGLVVGLLNYRGAYDASGDVYPSTGGSGTAGAVAKGDMWVISVAGILGGVAIQIGDSLIANVVAPGQTASKWNTINTNISYVPEDVANKSTDGTFASNSDALYPSQKASKTYVDNSASTASTPSVLTFLATEWGTASGGQYTLSYAASVHTRGLTPTFTVMELISGTIYGRTLCESELLDVSTGNISIKVSQHPDGRFAGKLIVNK